MRYILNKIEKQKLFGKIINLIGLPGSGKTSIAKKLKKIFQENRINVIHIDGDDLRKVLSEFSVNLKIREKLTKIYIKLALLLSNKDNVVLISSVSLNKSTDLIKNRKIRTFLIENNFRIKDKMKIKIRHEFFKKDFFLPKKIDKKILNGNLNNSCLAIINYFS